MVQSPSRVTLLGPTDSIASFGNYLFEVDRSGGSIRAVDVIAPLTPVVVSVAVIPCARGITQACGDSK